LIQERPSPLDGRIEPEKCSWSYLFSSNPAVLAVLARRVSRNCRFLSSSQVAKSTARLEKNLGVP